MPVVSVHQKVETVGEKTVTASDIITFEIWVEYENLPGDQCPAYVCS